MLLYPNFEERKKRTRTVDNNKKVYAARTKVLFKMPCFYYTPELIYSPKLLSALQIQE